MIAMLLPRLGVWSMSRRRISSRTFFRLVWLHGRICRKFGFESTSKMIDNWLESAKILWRHNLSDQLSALLASGKAECFIDLGAHVGEQSLLAAQYMPVYAFEPDPLAIEKLSRNIEDGKTKFPIEVIQKAATKFDGVANFYGHNRGSEITGSSSLNGSKRNVVGGDVYQVETCDIGKFLRDIPYHSLIIKCDVEGAEYEIIDSLGDHLIFDRVTAMFTEFHDTKIPGQWRKSLALTIWKRRKLGVNKSHLVEWC